MKLTEGIWNPSDRQLRQFGLVAPGVLPVIGWVWGAGTTPLLWLAGVGILLAILGFLRPRVLKPVFLGLSLITLPIGLVVGEVMMALVFYAVIVPIGLIFKLQGRDALHQKLQPKADTYWQPKVQPTDPASYFRPW